MNKNWLILSFFMAAPLYCFEQSLPPLSISSLPKKKVSVFTKHALSVCSGLVGGIMTDTAATIIFTMLLHDSDVNANDKLLRLPMVSAGARCAAILVGTLCFGVVHLIGNKILCTPKDEIQRAQQIHSQAVDCFNEALDKCPVLNLFTPQATDKAVKDCLIAMYGDVYSSAAAICTAEQAQEALGRAMLYDKRAQLEQVYNVSFQQACHITEQRIAGAMQNIIKLKEVIAADLQSQSANLEPLITGDQHADVDQTDEDAAGA
jgi:hypothetical protein